MKHQLGYASEAASTTCMELDAAALGWLPTGSRRGRLPIVPRHLTLILRRARIGAGDRKEERLSPG